MTKLDEGIDQLAKAIKSLPEVQQFFALREQILKDPFLNEQQALMKHHQKIMMKHIADADIYKKHQEAYKQCQSEFDQHPLVVNYVNLKEELSPLLNQLQSIIE
jgi:cell fate (sporulation/competence/biofilm development) regulator YmcA (YheA/YmcA/DUF963 family)